ncbi:MAG: NifU family protein [Candidatus Rokubacteria bacterium]|nr:NifU family protein [Candidatus Rokubacteria bacterium]
MSDDLKARVQELIESTINPAVAGHGGYVELIDVQENKVYLQMGGGCQGCGAADLTLKAGIERLIKEELPEVEEVLDTTDHSSGDNPYYTPGKESRPLACLRSPHGREREGRGGSVSGCQRRHNRGGEILPGAVIRHPVDEFRPAHPEAERNAGGNLRLSEHPAGRHGAGRHGEP